MSTTEERNGAMSPPLSTGSSYFSLNSESTITSRESEYVTAKESLSDENENLSSGSEIATLNGDPEDMLSIDREFKEVEIPNSGDDRDGEEECVKAFTYDIREKCDLMSGTGEQYALKKRKIDNAIKEGDINSLRELAVSEGGLVGNDCRSKAWPLLLGLNEELIEALSKKPLPTDLPNVNDSIKHLVGLDVSRVLKRFPPNLSDPEQCHLKKNLMELIFSVLNDNPNCHYYQGFHDISLTFLLVAMYSGNEVPNRIPSRSLSLVIEYFLHPYLEKTMEHTHRLIHVVFAVLEIENKKLFRRIVEETECPAAFSLAWVITWFSHTLPEESDIFRVTDFILGKRLEIQEPVLVPIFISSSLVLRNADKLILKTNEDRDFSTMHQQLSMLPQNIGSLEDLLHDSSKLMSKYSNKCFELIKRGVELKLYQQSLLEGTFVPKKPKRSVLKIVGRYKWLLIPVIIGCVAMLMPGRFNSWFTSAWYHIHRFF